MLPSGPTSNQLQHTISVTVAAAPVASIMAHLPEAVAVTTGFLAILWYLVLFGEKIVSWRAQWKQLHQSGTRVIAKENAALAAEKEPLP